MMEVDSVGSNILPQFGHATSPFTASTTDFASSGASSLGKTLIMTPRVRVGITARTAASEKTQPHGRSAMNGIEPDISLRDRGQTNGGRVGIFSVVEDDEGE